MVHVPTCLCSQIETFCLPKHRHPISTLGIILLMTKRLLVFEWQWDCYVTPWRDKGHLLHTGHDLGLWCWYCSRNPRDGIRCSASLETWVSLHCSACWTWLVWSFPCFSLLSSKNYRHTLPYLASATLLPPPCASMLSQEQVSLGKPLAPELAFVVCMW